MNVRSLCLRNFRNYKDTEITFSPGVNYIFGENAQGKTNLLEALYVLALGRSFRTPHLLEATLHGAPYFFLEMTFDHEDTSHTLSIYADKHGKKILYDRSPMKTLSQLLGVVPMVVFSYKDRLLISGTPSDRRLFLNLLLSQCDNHYKYALAYYHRALSQRNSLLKTQNISTLSVWNEQLATSGAYLTLCRYACCNTLNASLKNLWSNTLGEHLRIKFKSSLIKQEPPSQESLSQELHKQLSSSLNRDIDLGNTSVGPHRDDFILMVNSLPAAQFSSEGQKHTLLAVLRLAECLYIRDSYHISPLFCIDDIHSGLDSQRISQFLDLAPTLGQTFITSTSLLEHPVVKHNQSLYIHQSQVLPYSSLKNSHLY